MRPRTLVIAMLAIVAIAVVLGVIQVVTRRPPVAEPPVAARSRSAEPTLTGESSFPLPGRPPLRNPLGIAAAGGELFVAESDAGAVRVFGSDGRDVASFAVPRASAAPVAYPADVAVLDRDRLAVVDTAGSRVVLMSRKDGRLLGVLGSKESTEAPLKPTAVAAGGDELFVADAGDHTIKVYTREGRRIRVLGAALRPPLTFVGGMTVSARRLLVSDSNAGRVLVLDAASGSQLALLPAARSLPRGIAVDPDGGVFVVDAFERSIASFDASLTPVGSLAVSGGGVAASHDPSPRGAAFDAETRRLYVTDSGAGVVHVYGMGRGR